MPEITQEELEQLNAAKARRELQRKVMKKLNASFTREQISKRNKKAWRTRRIKTVLNVLKRNPKTTIYK